jgi:arsenite oxidase small subunit
VTSSERKDPKAGADGENTVPRRQFSKFLTVAGLAVLLGVIWALLRKWLGKPAVLPQKVIARKGEIAVGDFKIFQYPTDEAPCILVRTAPDTYVAYSRLCTHQQCAIFYQPGSTYFQCPCHQGFFSVADGSVLQGPPPRPLPKILLEWRGDELLAVGEANR